MISPSSSEQAGTLFIEQALEQAIAHHKAGRLQEADDLYRAVLKAQSNHPDANHNLGVLAVQARQPAAALPHFRAALNVNPNEVQYWLSYIDALIQAGQVDEARRALGQARQLGMSGDAVEALTQRLETLKGSEPSAQNVEALVAVFGGRRYADAANIAQTMTLRYPLQALGWKTLGAALKEMGRSGEALAPMNKAAELAPNDPEVHFNLATVFKDLGHLDEAEASCRRALQIHPGFPEAHGNLGGILLNRRDPRRLGEAEAYCRRAVELKPDYYGAYVNLGYIFEAQERLEEAAINFERALEINQRLPNAHNSLGNILCRLGRYAEAEASFRRALDLAPDLAEACNNLGNVLHVLGRFPEAEAMCRRALELQPEMHHAHNNLGNTLQMLQRFDEAAASCRRAAELKPDFFESYNNLGNILLLLGDLSGAADSYRRALRIKPDFNLAHSNLLFCLSNDERVEVQTLYEEHRAFGERFEEPFRSAQARHLNARDPERRLQVGFVSADLRDHAVAYFIEPILAWLAGRPNLSLHAYSSSAFEDHVSQRLRGHFAHWNGVAGQANAALAEKIRGDGIDILIDLSGHTAHNRLMTFARRPAPVQASWIGYPGTTGMRAIDYYLADRFFLPHAQFDGQFTEKLVHLPAYAAFRSLERAPPVNALPALSAGTVTFGSFNRPSKLSHSTIACWSRLLRALPDSSLLIAGLPRQDGYEALSKRFAQEGVAPQRLRFYPRCGIEDYLALHRQVDVCLDTFAYNGGTTTLHALWMGVPTLTVAGDTAPRRQGAANLGHVGLDAFIARDAAEFVQMGQQWAGKPKALARLRSGLRKRFGKSAIGQPALAAAGLERALRVMWQRWCAGRSPAPFDVD